MRESPRGRESMKIRLDVHVGAKGQFAERIAQRSREGVETVSPLYTGRSLAMSSVNHLPKRSVDFTKCVGLIAIGRGAEGRNDSCIVHAMPTHNPLNLLQYRAALHARLTDFMARVDPSSAQIGMLGGCVVPVQHMSAIEGAQALNEWYAQTTALLGDSARKAVGTEPRQLDRPNEPGEHIDFFLDTEDAALYIERYVDPA